MIAPTSRPTLLPTVGPTLTPAGSGYYYQQSFSSANCLGTPVSLVVYALGICTGSGQSYNMLTSTGVSNGNIIVVQTSYLDAACQIKLSGLSVAPISTSYSTSCAAAPGSTSTQYVYSVAYPAIPMQQYYVSR